MFIDMNEHDGKLTVDPSGLSFGTSRLNVADGGVLDDEFFDATCDEPSMTLEIRQQCKRLRSTP